MYNLQIPDSQVTSVKDARRDSQSKSPTTIYRFQIPKSPLSKMHDATASQSHHLQSTDSRFPSHPCLRMIKMHDQTASQSHHVQSTGSSGQRNQPSPESSLLKQHHSQTRVRYHVQYNQPSPQPPHVKAAPPSHSQLPRTIQSTKSTVIPVKATRPSQSHSPRRTQSTKFTAIPVKTAPPSARQPSTRIQSTKPRVIHPCFKIKDSGEKKSDDVPVRRTKGPVVQLPPSPTSPTCQ